MGDKNWRFGVVANIVKEHIDSEGNVWHGTKEFVGGAKVYIDGKNYPNYERTKIVVIGLGRYHKYEVIDLYPELLENIRFHVIRKPIILEIMKNLEWMEGWHWYGRTAEDKREAQKFVVEWENHVKEMNKRRNRNIV